MIRSALLLCAAIIAAACSACVERKPVVTSGLGTGTTTCTPTDFADAVKVLGGAPYTPQYLTPPTTSTTMTSLQSGTPPYQDLVAAFSMASPAFRSKLCLISVYIDPFATNSSWGFRNPNDTSQRYIGLSATLWGASIASHAQPLHVYETNLLANVMNAGGMPWPTNSMTKPPQFTASSGASFDTPATSVLAALAHEFGHILWFDLIKGSSGSALYDPTTFCRDATKPNSGYFDRSWLLPVSPPNNNWTAFGYITGTHISGTNQIQYLKTYLTEPQPDFGTAARLLNSFYASDSMSTSDLWPGLFGAISPNEDFVETFTLYVLTTDSAVQVTSMPLNIYDGSGSSTPSYKPDLYADFRNANDKMEVKLKMKCIFKSYSKLFGL
jgi:hypothetical protein